MKCYKTIFTIIFLALSTNASAALVDHGSFTTDNSTDLDWLDITASTGLSYDYVSTQFGTGGQFEGWSFASSSQILSFLNSAGGSGTYAGWDSNHDSVVGQLQSLWGITGYVGATPRTRFFTPEIANNSGWIWAGLILDDAVNGGYINLEYASSGKDDADLEIGHTLVRASVVPVPAAAWLFGSGLIGLIGFAKRRA